jgi:hypothetical protein
MVEIGCHCVVCNEDYGTLHSQQVFPRSLPCGHSVCSLCLNLANFTTCPMRCPGVFNSKGTLPVNRLAQEIIAQCFTRQLSQPAGVLDEKDVEEDDFKADVVEFTENCDNWAQCKQKARHLCRECSIGGVLLCETCSSQIHSFAMFKNHKLQPPKKKDIVSAACGTHGERLKFLCQTDGQILCRDCFDPLTHGDHVGHTVIAAIPAIEKRFNELQKLSKEKLESLQLQNKASGDFLAKAQRTESEFSELIAVISRHRETVSKEFQLLRRKAARLSSKIQAASDQPCPTVEGFIEYIRTDAVNHHKLLQEVDEQKVFKIVEDSRTRCTLTITELQRHFQQLHDSFLAISPTKSTVSIDSCGQRGEIRITGIAENGEQTSGKSSEFEITFDPTEDVKYELEETPGQKGIWSITYELPSQRGQRCSVKYLSQELVGSPVTICNSFRLEWESNISLPQSYSQLYRFNGPRAEKALQSGTMSIIRGRNLLPVSSEALLQWEVKCFLVERELHVGVVPSNYNWSLCWLQQGGADGTSIFLTKSCNLVFKLECGSRTLTIYEASGDKSDKNRKFTALKTYTYDAAAFQTGLYFAGAIRNTGGWIEFQQ